MKRVVRLVSIVLLAAVFLVVAFAALLFVTPAGVGIVLRAIETAMPAGSLEVRGFRGVLLGEICADAVTYRQEGLEVSAREPCVVLKVWESVDFLKLGVRSFDAAQVLVRTSADEAPAETGERAISLPFPIELERGRVALLEVNGLALANVETGLALADADVRSASRFRYRDVQVELETRGPWSRLELSSALSIPERVTIDGWLDLRGRTLPFELVVGAAALPLSRFIERDLVAADARLEISGDLDAYRYALSGTFTDTALGHGDVRFRGRGDLEEIGFEGVVSGVPSSDLVGALDALELAGTVRWRPELAFDVRARAREVPIDAGGYRALVSGNVHASGGVSAVAIEATDLGGTLNGVPVSGVARVDWRAGSNGGYSIDVHEARFEAGAGKVAITGRVLENARLDFEFDGRDLPLPVIRGDLSGRLSGEGSLAGTLGAPELDARVTLESIAFAGHEAGRIELGVDGSMAAGRGSIRIDDAALRGGNGMPALAGIALEARGAYRRAGDWVLDLERLGFAYVDAAVGPVAFKLGQPARVEVGAGTVRVAETCLRASVAALATAPASVCGEVRYPDGPLRLRIAEFRLAGMHSPGGEVFVGGRLHADLDFETLSPLAGGAKVELGDVRVVTPDAAPLQLGGLAIGAAVENGMATVTLTTSGEQPLEIGGEIRSTLADPLGASTLSGRVTASVDGIWAVETFLPPGVTYEVSNMRGALALDVEVGGTVGNPLVTGGLTVRDGGFDLLALGTELADVTLDATLQDSERARVQTLGRIGPGTFSAVGTLDALREPERSLRADLELDGARLVDLPDYVAEFDGNVTAALRPDALDVDGKLTMSRADLSIRSLPETAIAVSSDAVVIGEDEMGLDARVQRLRTTDLELTLGRDVHLEAFGLDTRLRGRLRVRERPGLPLEVTGTITLEDGVFEAYGQELEVERGRLTFTGTVDDPVVDVLASRVVPYGDGEVTVSLLLGGTAKALTTEVRSRPLLPEGDALALLMTGRTLSEMSNQEQTNVYSAAIALGLYGASNLTRGVANTLGLEEIILEQDTAGEVKVGASVRLNRDLYLRYTYGVFSRLGGVLLRYQLNRRLSVQAQTGDEQSIEIRYGVDN